MTPEPGTRLNSSRRSGLIRLGSFGNHPGMGPKSSNSPPSPGDAPDFRPSATVVGGVPGSVPAELSSDSPAQPAYGGVKRRQDDRTLRRAGPTLRPWGRS